ncbi:hypothetical protein [Sphaerisporangium fuscum]|nr:hypothetical protein [Sphaerisporangium fuscum]
MDQEPLIPHVYEFVAGVVPFLLAIAAVLVVTVVLLLVLRR